MNLLGTELVRDLVSLIQRAEADATFQVLVFASADPDYSLRTLLARWDSLGPLSAFRGRRGGSAW